MNEQEFFGENLDALSQSREKMKKREAAEERKRKAQEEAARQKRDQAEAVHAKEEGRVHAEFKPGSDPIAVALETIVQLPDFERIRTEFLSLPDLMYKIKYIDRVMYDRTDFAYRVLSDPPTNTRFHYSLSTIGMPMLCPYLRLENANRTTHEDCLIDGDEEPIMAICQGRHDICVVFKDRAMNAALGRITLPVPPAGRVSPLGQKCLVDLEDLDDYWLMEGKYD